MGDGKPEPAEGTEGMATASPKDDLLRGGSMIRGLDACGW